MSRGEDLLAYLTRMMKEEGCIVIRPRKGPFRYRYEPEFVERIRHLPASLDIPPGREISDVRFTSGSWAFVWMPDE